MSFECPHSTQSEYQSTLFSLRNKADFSNIKGLWLEFFRYQEQLQAEQFVPVSSRVRVSSENIKEGEFDIIRAVVVILCCCSMHLAQASLTPSNEVYVAPESIFYTSALKHSFNTKVCISRWVLLLVKQYVRRWHRSFSQFFCLIQRVDAHNRWVTDMFIHVKVRLLPLPHKPSALINSRQQYLCVLLTIFVCK